MPRSRLPPWKRFPSPICRFFSLSGPGTPLGENEAKEAYANFVDGNMEGVESLKDLDVPEKYYQGRVEIDVLMEKLKEKVVSIPEEAEQVNLRGILVDVASVPIASGTTVVTPGTSTSIEEVASAIKSRLAEGESFSVLASEFSVDADSASYGGELGWYPRDVLSPEIGAVAFDLPVGVILQGPRLQR